VVVRLAAGGNDLLHLATQRSWEIVKGDLSYCQGKGTLHVGPVDGKELIEPALPVREYEPT
jgi:hypothetical protein